MYTDREKMEKFLEIYPETFIDEFVNSGLFNGWFKIKHFEIYEKYKEFHNSEIYKFDNKKLELKLENFNIALDCLFNHIYRDYFTIKSDICMIYPEHKAFRNEKTLGNINPDGTRTHTWDDVREEVFELGKIVLDKYKKLLITAKNNLEQDKNPKNLKESYIVPEYDHNSRILNFNGKKILISKKIDSDTSNLMKTIYKNKYKVWENGEILEDWGYFPEEKITPNKIYHAGKNINKIIAQETTIKDFLNVSTKNVFIKKKYLNT